MFSAVAIAQMNPTVGDIPGNLAKIRRFRAEAAASNAALVVFPECAVCGYPPEDLALMPSFRAACREAVLALAAETATGPALLVGSVWEHEGKVYNAALLLAEGRVQGAQFKRILPNYGVFDEHRLFTPGTDAQVFSVGGTRVGVLLCEDAWHSAITARYQGKTDLLVAINASPFEAGKHAQRQRIAADAARATGAPLVYVNMVGGQDELVFDGGSFALNADGTVAHQWPHYVEQLFTPTTPSVPLPAPEALLWQAACLGLSDYVRKNNFPGVLLGLSGGIDSAVAATLAVDALGKDAVTGVLLPSALTSAESVEDAEALAKNLGIRTHTVPIQAPREAVHSALSGVLTEVERGTLAVDGNLQSRLRGLTLMALSNATRRMVVATGNKSEVATGYTTLYGDSCGGYAPLKDLYKTHIYALAAWRNQNAAPIPLSSITKAPTAELAPGQKDEDQLPPYALLDAILFRLVECREDSATAASHGFDPAVVARVAMLLRVNEYKRRQMPPGPKLSAMSFGRDWRFPLTKRG